MVHANIFVSTNISTDLQLYVLDKRGAGWSPPAGELDQVLGKDARQTWWSQICNEGALGPSGWGPFLDLEDAAVSFMENKYCVGSI